MHIVVIEASLARLGICIFWLFYVHILPHELMQLLILQLSTSHYFKGISQPGRNIHMLLRSFHFPAVLL